jgi:hypothetical protein
MTRESSERRTGNLTTRRFVPVEASAVIQKQEVFRSFGIE